MRTCPLVIPEVNAGEIARHRGIIANPNCVVLVAMTPLWPLHQANPIRRIVLASYQSASGGGAAMMEELRLATDAHLAGRPFQPKVLKHDYAFNLFSHNTKVDLATGYNEEETKVVNETRKIFGAPELRISPTCIRVPVLRAHSAALTVECERPIAPEEVRAIMSQRAGRARGRRPGEQPFPDAEGRLRAGRHPGRPHPPRHRRPERADGGPVRRRRPAPEGCGAQRGADRRIAADRAGCCGSRVAKKRAGLAARPPFFRPQASSLDKLGMKKLSMKPEPTPHPEPVEG